MTGRFLRGILCLMKWLPGTTSTSVNLNVIQNDIRNQLAHSQDLLTLAQKLQAVVDKIEDAEAKKIVQEVVSGMLQSIRGVTANVATTTSTVSGGVSVWRLIV